MKNTGSSGVTPPSADAHTDPDAAGRTNRDTATIIGAVIGSYQADAFQKHGHRTHVYTGYGGAGNLGALWADQNYANSHVDDPIPLDVNIPLKTSDKETRPVNIYVNYIIKY